MYKFEPKSWTLASQQSYNDDRIEMWRKKTGFFVYGTILNACHIDECCRIKFIEN